MKHDGFLRVVEKTAHTGTNQDREDPKKNEREAADELMEIRKRLAELEHLASRYLESFNTVQNEEERLRTILDSVQSGIVIIDAESHIIVDINEVATEMIGVPRDEIIGTVCHKYVCPAEQGKCPITDLDQTVDNTERVLLGPDGRATPIIKTVSTIDMYGRKHLLECFLDNTERKRANEEIKRYRTELEALVEERTTELAKVNKELQGRIAERRQTEDSLKKNETLLRLILNLSTNFICLPPEEADDGINDVLKAIGQYAGVDRSYIFQFNEDCSMMDNTHEWCASGIIPQMATLQGISANVMPWFFENIKRFETIHIPDVTKLPVEAEAEKEEFIREGIQSLVVVPVISNNCLIGFLGFDSVRSQKAWPENIISLLKIVGEIVANALAQKKAAEAVRYGSAKYQTLFENANDAIFLIKDGVFIDGNQKTLEMFRCTREQIIGQRPRTFYPETQPCGTRSYKIILEKIGLVESGHPQYFEFRHRRLDGTFFDAEVSLNRVDIAQEVLVQAIVRDITARKNSEYALQESEKRYHSLFGESQDAIYITSEHGEFIDVNRSFLNLFGYTRDEISGLKTKDTCVNKKDMENLGQILSTSGSTKGFEVKLKKKYGAVMDCLLTVTAKKDAEGNTIGYHGIIRDITAEKIAEQTIRHMAYHDALTGLPNRTLFNDRFNIAILNAKRNRKQVAVMILDLDKFKNINDTLGHKVGDELLKGVGERLTGILRKSDTVARMGGDEFLIVLPEIVHIEDAQIVAGKILQGFSETFVINEQPLSVTTSIGIAMYPQDGTNIETLIKHADIAMYSSKVVGRNQYTRYSPQL